MMPSQLAGAVVNGQLALMRFGWVNGLACLLLWVALFGWLWLVPHLRAETNDQKRALIRVQKELNYVETTPPIAQSITQQRLASFYDTLGDARHAEQQIKTVFAIAAKNGLTLTRADYKSGSSQSGRHATYQIVLPVKGTYPAIRAFCEQTMLAIAFASLDEIRFKREAIASNTLEAQLRLTLYLNVAPGASDGPQRIVASTAEAIR